MLHNICISCYSQRIRKIQLKVTTWWHENEIQFERQFNLFFVVCNNIQYSFLIWCMQFLLNMCSIKAVCFFRQISVFTFFSLLVVINRWNRDDVLHSALSVFRSHRFFGAGKITERLAIIGVYWGKMCDKIDAVLS